MMFEGFVTFLDQPKEGVREAIAGLAALGVSVKVITGDSRLVARHVAELVGLRSDRMLDGRQLDLLHGAALWRSVDDTELFAEVDPDQKERIILAAKRWDTSSAFSATASTMRRRCTRPTPAFRGAGRRRRERGRRLRPARAGARCHSTRRRGRPQDVREHDEATS
jgi:hypothetical protein